MFPIDNLTKDEKDLLKVLNKSEFEYDSVSEKAADVLDEEWTTYLYKICYEDVKYFPEFDRCFTREGREHNDWLEMYINYENEDITCFQESQDGYGSIEVPAPSFSYNLEQYLLDHVKNFVNEYEEEKKTAEKEPPLPLVFTSPEEKNILEGLTNITAGSHEDESAEVMNDLLLGNTSSRFRVFEDIAERYMYYPGERNGIDYTVRAITGKSMESILKMIKERIADREEKDGELYI